MDKIDSKSQNNLLIDEGQTEKYQSNEDKFFNPQLIESNDSLA